MIVGKVRISIVCAFRLWNTLSLSLRNLITIITALIRVILVELWRVKVGVNLVF
jgi:hypothetical protein